MKATLEFSIPEEQSDFLLAFNARDYHSTLRDLREAFRGRAKHSDRPATWNEAYELFLETLNDREIDLG